MANVLNEFLHGVSKGFQDAAFASFSRRRSTVREDINQSFVDTAEAAAPPPGQSYLDMLNTGESASTSVSEAKPAPALKAPAKRGRAAGVAGSKPAKRGPKGGRRGGGVALREV
jgi:hypothetical protein